MHCNGKSKVLSIVGPTATGKSELAVELAERLGGEIINADALQVYRELEIGTAKPEPELRARVRHHLVDVLEPTESFSAGRFTELARAAIGDIQARDKVALVVGGSGLYQRALLEGLAPIPSVPAEVRARVLDEIEAEGLAAAYRRLEAIDPVTAARLAPGDPQRIGRALEIYEFSGKPLSVWLSESPAEPALPAVRLGLTLSRPILYDRIESRVFRMMENGWVDEVRRLYDRYVVPVRAQQSEEGTPRGRNLPAAFQAIGYRELIRFCEGEIAFDVATEEIIRATRRYAKRQLTWFRREEGIHWYDASNASAQLAEMMDVFTFSDS